jgi:hypothetical protein
VGEEDMGHASSADLAFDAVSVGQCRTELGLQVGHGASLVSLPQPLE